MIVCLFIYLNNRRLLYYGTMSICEVFVLYKLFVYLFICLFTGECSEAQVLEMFISNFLDTTTRGEVTYEEFAEYYEGLSVCIENNEDFENILKNAWSI